MLFLLFCGEVHAVGAIVGIILEVRIDASGSGLATFDQQIVGAPPSCVGPGYGGSLAFDTKTPGGRAIYAMALIAKETKASIHAEGSGTCEIYGVVESWNLGVILK